MDNGTHRRPPERSGPSPPTATRPSSSRSAAGCAATGGRRGRLDGYADGRAVARVAPGRSWRPWPNRIRDGQLHVRGQAYQLTLTEPARHNAIHGLVNWVRWRLVEQAADAVTLEYDLPPQPGYPWPLRAAYPVERRRGRAARRRTR